jgi:hypothetical protein
MSCTWLAAWAATWSPIIVRTAVVSISTLSAQHSDFGESLACTYLGVAVFDPFDDALDCLCQLIRFLQ